MKTSSRFISTGQAAKHCSVTPDTILKWIRSGLLPARRTAGGHHRINEQDLERVLHPSPDSTKDLPLAPDRRTFKYCWQFNGNKGEIPEGCLACAVYQMRAHRCYEVARLTPEAGHPKLFCKTSCQECDYYRLVHEQDINVLVVSDDTQLTQALQKEADRYDFNIELTDCEYTCSAAISHFRPDFAIVDCSIGSQLSRDICNHLHQDPRAPFVRVVLAGEAEDFPIACDKEVFARIRRPFNIQDIADCILGASERASGE